MKIQLHTPMNLSDRETITEFEANDISQVRSTIGDDAKEGTNFWIKNVPEEQFCVESATAVKALIKQNKSEEEIMSIGTVHIGDNIEQKGLNFLLWFKDVKFFGGFICGVAASYLASWLFKITIGG